MAGNNMTDFTVLLFEEYLLRLNSIIESEHCKDAYDGLRIVQLEFRSPYLRCADFEVISLAVMRLLIKYAYNTSFAYGKFSIGYVIKVPTRDISFTVTKTTISLNDSHGNAVPNMDVFNMIMKVVMKAVEDYEKEVISWLFLRLYISGMQDKEVTLSEDEINSQLRELINSGIVGGEPQAVKSMVRKPHYPNYVTTLPARRKDMKPFIVANTETILVNDVHVPYAAGYLIVYRGDDIATMPNYATQMFFSEDSAFVMPEFEERSHNMLSQFLMHLGLVAKRRNINTVYFHNLSRFNGILLLKYYASHEVF